MKSTIDMAREAELICSIDNPTTPWVEDHDLTLHLKAFEALVRADAIADERNSWPAEMEAMERQVNILTDALTQSRKPLTVEQLEKGREQTFSTNNPFCPCDSKTFRKVAKWVEAAHGIKENT